MQKSLIDTSLNPSNYFVDFILSTDSTNLYLQTAGGYGNLLRKLDLEGNVISEIIYSEFFNWTYSINGFLFLHDLTSSNVGVSTLRINEENSNEDTLITEGIDQIFDLKAREGGGYWCIGDPMGSIDMCVAALDENMDTLWTKTVSGPHYPINIYNSEFNVERSKIFPGNNVHIITTTQKRYQFDSPPRRALIIAINNSGDNLWTYNFLKGNSSARINDAVRLNDNSILATGFYGITPSGIDGSFVFKLNFDGTVGMSQLIPFQKSQAPYPNPTSDFLHTTPEIDKRIYNMQG